MKHILTLLAIFITSLTFSQDKIEKTVGEFSTLKVYDLIEVTMIQSDEDKLVITGKNTEDVVVVNRNGKLKIKMKLKEIFDGNNTNVTLYFTKIDVIDANEGAKISVIKTLKQFEVDLKTQEGGKISIDSDVTYLNIRAVTGGVIEVIGKAKNQDISLYTGGIYKGENCITQNANIAIRVAGEAYVNATEKVAIKIRAGGDVYIYGNPRVIDESRVFGGRIKRID
jgi:hypothetical protein